MEKTTNIICIILIVSLVISCAVPAFAMTTDELQEIFDTVFSFVFGVFAFGYGIGLIIKLFKWAVELN